MMPPRDESTPSGDLRLRPGADPDADRERLRRLAHELNGLLDGSLRALGLAESSVRELAADAGDDDRDPEDDAAAAAERRLGHARTALGTMAELLAGVLGDADPGARDDAAAVEEAVRRLAGPAGETAGDAVRRLGGLLEDLAAAAEIPLAIDVDDAAAHRPAGPLPLVLQNAVRNAVAACERAGGGRVAVRIAARSLTPARTGMIVEVEDTGVGLDGSGDPAGHGVGLASVRAALDVLGGSCELAPGEGGRGARFVARWPLRPTAPPTPRPGEDAR